MEEDISKKGSHSENVAMISELNTMLGMSHYPGADSTWRATDWRPWGVSDLYGSSSGAAAHL